MNNYLYKIIKISFFIYYIKQLPLIKSFFKSNIHIAISLIVNYIILVNEWIYSLNSKVITLIRLLEFNQYNIYKQLLTAFRLCSM